MSVFEEYLSQSTESGMTSHYDEHTDRWVDEGDQPWGNSGYVDIHTDEA